MKVKASSLKTVESLIKSLYLHAKAKGQFPRSLTYGYNESTNRCLEVLRSDKNAVEHKSGNCPGLCQAGEHLTDLMQTIRTLP